ncbi:Protein UNC-79 b [Aphelenchoides avenae]|nr:Protein UNC-79 b [Aphelenchus avenae]
MYKYRCDVSSQVTSNICKLIQIVITTIEAHCHYCGPATEVQQTEYVLWTDTSDDSDAEGKVIKEEDDTVEVVEERQHTPSGGKKQPHVRPESLKVSRSTGSAHQLTTYSETADRPSDTISMASAPPGRSVSGLLTVGRRGRRKARKKLRHVRAEMVRLRCGFCNEHLDSFDEETISLCLIALSTFLHREPSLAAPSLFRMITAVTRYVDYTQFTWQETNVFVPGNSRSAAKQFLRVALHQLSPSGIAFQLFDSVVDQIDSFWTAIATSLADFNELNPVALIVQLLEDIVDNWKPNLARILFNLAAYIQSTPLDAYLNTWSSTATLMDTFLRRFHSEAFVEQNNQQVSFTSELKSLVVIIDHFLRVQNFSTFKSAVSLMEAFAKFFAEALHERDKQCLTRALVAELIQAIKFKCELVEHNYMVVVDLILQDYGEEVGENLELDQFNTGASEAVRPFLNDVLEFISDLHVLAKLKVQETNRDSACYLLTRC